MNAAILPQAKHKPVKKWPGAIFNVAQRRPAGWPPGMAGHKNPSNQSIKPVQRPYASAKLALLTMEFPPGHEFV
jgi:hypothetical protein